MRRGTFFQSYPVTSAFLVACLGVYAMEAFATYRLAGPGSLTRSLLDPAQSVLYILGANDIARVRRGEAWRLLASVFLHGSLIHIALNLFAFVDLGRLCEPLLGRARFAVALVAAGIGGSLASGGWALYTGAAGRHLSVGSSGAIVGLIGLLLAYSIRHRYRELRDGLLHGILFIVLLSLLISHVDHAAHAGGFAVGALFGAFTPRQPAREDPLPWRIAAALALAAAAGAIGIALWRYFLRGDFR